MFLEVGGFRIAIPMIQRCLLHISGRMVSVYFTIRRPLRRAALRAIGDGVTPERTSPASADMEIIV
jgi:hypothetical protein